MFRSTASLALSVLLIAACAATPSPSLAPPVAVSATTSAVVASPTPSPSPSGRPVLDPTPASSPATSAWPLTVISERGLEPAFGPDGTVYLLTGGPDAQLVALDRGGHAKPGWPIGERPGADFGSPAVGADGSVYFEECAGPTVGCALHRLDLAGRDLSGWPVELPSEFACSAGGRCSPNAVDVGADGTAYVSHWREAGGLQVLAVDASAKIKPGWPVAPDADGAYWSNVQIGSDGTLFILRVPDGSDSQAILAAFGQDGRPRAGWPVSVPDKSAYLLGPQGTVVLWSLIDDVGELCSNPRRTVFTVLGPDGRTLPGWPRGSKGYASSPVVDTEGTVYYVSATSKVYAHDRAGEVKTGWPVAVPGAGNGCGPASPHLAPDGTIYVLGDEVVARSPDGRSRPGWPQSPTGQLILPCLDTDCVSNPVRPAFGPDGTIYLVVYRPDPAEARLEVVALDRQGQLKTGWPYHLPFDPTSVEVGSLTVSPDGRLFVRGGGYLLLALDTDGRVSR